MAASGPVCGASVAVIASSLRGAKVLWRRYIWSNASGTAFVPVLGYNRGVPGVACPTHGARHPRATLPDLHATAGARLRYVSTSTVKGPSLTGHNAHVGPELPLRDGRPAPA